MTALWQLFRSVKLALLLIILLTVATLLGVSIPQQELPGDGKFAAWGAAHPNMARWVQTLGITEVFTSWWFGLLVVLLFLNTLVCTIDQVKVLRKRREKVPLTMANPRLSLPVADGKEAMNKAVQYLTENGYRREMATCFAGKEVIVLCRSRLGDWGSIIFHGGLLVILLGVLTSVLVNMKGAVELTEGQTFVDTHENYFQIEESLLYPERHSGFELTLKKVEEEWDESENNYMARGSVEIVQDGEIVRKVEVDRAHPFTYQGMKFVLAKKGYTPVLNFYNDRGQLVRKYHINFDRSVVNGRVKHSKAFLLEDFGLTFDAILFPDLRQLPNGKFINGSMQPKNPGLFLMVSSEKGFMGSQLLLLGGEIKVGGLKVEFAELNRWLGFWVTKDWGVPVMVFGSWLSIAGVAVLYLLVPRRVVVSRERTGNGDVLDVSGAARLHPHLFERELTGIKRIIKGESR